MDTSNPILPQDRRTVEEILESQRLRRRQDLGYLRDIAMTAERVHLKVESPLVDAFEVKSMYDDFVKSIVKVPGAKGEALSPLVFKKVFDELPVSGLLTDDGLPIHPAGKNNSKGMVCVNRVMGGSPRAPDGLKSIIEIFGDEVLARKHVYTGGTWEGFVNRLGEQMGRSTVSVFDMFQRELGYKPKLKKMYAILDELFPRSGSGDWPSLEGDLELHLKKMKITASSSAGAPYWRNKGECMFEIIDVGLPIIIEAMKTPGGLDELFRKNPEMFLCEVKNKVDRYKISELEKKTRPYCCLPAHWGLLFSILAQKFQADLKTFDQDNRSVNAYGFCPTGGGLKRMYDWMTNVGKRDYASKYVVYGDDSCLVVRGKDGKLYRIDPDFKQMDGSLDQKDISLVVQWVLNTNLRADGIEENKFWSTVAAQWEYMASDPMFLVDGKAVYQKCRPNGMMSGVPGTTLFDTVKSALAWHVYFEVCQRDKLNPMDEKLVTDFMKRNGLVIKPGTWSPEVIPPLVNGQLITDHKFLGVQMRCREHKGNLIVVPTIPEDDALEMLVVQKDDPFVKEPSQMQRARRLYDRARGLFITFGFDLPKIKDALHNIVNHLDPTAILLLTNLGTGERPEHFMWEDYTYPDSSGFPTTEYCYDLYSSEVSNEHWIQIYPSLVSTMELLRAETREVTLKVKKLKLHAEWLKESSQPIALQLALEKDTSTPRFSKEFSVLDTVAPVQKPPKNLQPNPRSEIKTVSNDHRKRIPTMGESIVIKVKDAPRRVDEILRDFAISPQQLEQICQDYGIYYTSMCSDGIVSRTPLQTPVATRQNETVQAAQEKAQLVNVGTKYRDAVLKATKTLAQERHMNYVQTCQSLTVVKAMIEDIKGHPPKYTPRGMNDVIPTLNRWLHSFDHISQVRWRVVKNHEGEVNPVEVSLDINILGEEWVSVASCRGATKKFASLYIARALFAQAGVALRLDQFSIRIETKQSLPKNEKANLKQAFQDEIEKSVMVPKSEVDEVDVTKSHAPVNQRRRLNKDFIHFLEDRYFKLGETERAPTQLVEWLVDLIEYLEAGGISRNQAKQEARKKYAQYLKKGELPEMAVPSLGEAAGPREPAPLAQPGPTTSEASAILPMITKAELDKEKKRVEKQRKLHAKRRDTPEKRALENRKLLERRKKKKRNQASSTPNSPPS